MADTEQVRNAGRRLATDLRDLREARKIKPESIIKATRLTVDVFERFDESALVDHPAFNRVYIRSVVASYARVLGIDEDLACRGLDEALDGTYAGGIRRVYIEGLPVDEWSEPIDSDAAQLADALEGTTETPGLFNKDESDSDVAHKPGIFALLGNRKLIPFILLIVVALAILILINKNSSSDVEETEIGNSIIPVPGPPPEPKWILLGDSIRFDIIATTEKLDPIRVKVDSDSLRPYWIEHLDTLTFYVRRNVIFRRELDVADILMDGYLLPDTMINSSDQIELSRESAQAWLDSLAVKEVARNRPLS